jgi:uncharacterized protein YutE (UPF0331/DUF86 family)
MARVEAHRKSTADQLALDTDALELVAFNLLLAVQAATDIAAHLVADEGWQAAETVAELFVRLETHGVISAESSDAMRRATRFRNVVAHGYAGIDVGAAHEASTAGLGDLDRFAREIATWLVSREG